MAQTHAGTSPDTDWTGIAESEDFKELTKKRRSFVIPATAFFAVWYFGFIILAGYAPDFMGERVVEGVTIGYLFALSQFIMTWVLAGLYLRRSNRELDPIRKRILDSASASTSGDGGAKRGIASRLRRRGQGGAS
jgi:uncharacterized membrane protein (DUF485 family)